MLFSHEVLVCLPIQRIISSWTSASGLFSSQLSRWRSSSMQTSRALTSLELSISSPAKIKRGIVSSISGVFGTSLAAKTPQFSFVNFIGKLTRYHIILKILLISLILLQITYAEVPQSVPSSPLDLQGNSRRIHLPLLLPQPQSAPTLR